jgi:hypothetical protein
MRRAHGFLTSQGILIALFANRAFKLLWGHIRGRSAGEFYAQDPHWAEALPRLASVGLLPDDPTLLKFILDQMTSCMSCDQR